MLIQKLLQPSSHKLLSVSQHASEWCAKECTPLYHWTHWICMNSMHWSINYFKYFETESNALNVITLSLVYWIGELKRWHAYSHVYRWRAHLTACCIAIPSTTSIAKHHKDTQSTRKMCSEDSSPYFIKCLVVFGRKNVYSWMHLAFYKSPARSKDLP
jgi:hypothetical protein